MVIVALDDEKLALNALMEAIQGAMPQAEVQGFRNPLEAIRFIEANECAVVFLDIEMRELNGIEVAKKMKCINPKVNIIFVTGYSEYTGDAFALHASGYVLKPVTQEKIEVELEELRHPIQPVSSKRIRVQAFGNFEVFIDEQPVKFQYSKTKELLAYLVDRRGAMCTNGELVGILWEDEESTGRVSYLKNIRADLLSTLEKLQCGDLVIRQRGKIGIVPDKIQCDYYDWLEGKVSGINAYLGEYMMQYSWSEYTNLDSYIF